MSVFQLLIGNAIDPFFMSGSLNLGPFASPVGLAVWTGRRGGVPRGSNHGHVAFALSEFPDSRPIAVLRSRNVQV